MSSPAKSSVAATAARTSSSSKSSTIAKSQSAAASHSPSVSTQDPLENRHVLYVISSISSSSTPSFARSPFSAASAARHIWKILILQPPLTPPLTGTVYYTVSKDTKISTAPFFFENEFPPSTRRSPTSPQSPHMSTSLPSDNLLPHFEALRSSLTPKDVAHAQQILLSDKNAADDSADYVVAALRDLEAAGLVRDGTAQEWSNFLRRDGPQSTLKKNSASGSLRSASATSSRSPGDSAQAGSSTGPDGLASSGGPNLGRISGGRRTSSGTRAMPTSSSAQPQTAAEILAGARSGVPRHLSSGASSSLDPDVALINQSRQGDVIVGTPPSGVTRLMSDTLRLSTAMGNLRADSPPLPVPPRTTAPEPTYRGASSSNSGPRLSAGPSTALGKSGSSSTGVGTGTSPLHRRSGLAAGLLSRTGTLNASSATMTLVSQLDHNDRQRAQQLDFQGPDRRGSAASPASVERANPPQPKPPTDPLFPHLHPSPNLTSGLVEYCQRASPDRSRPDTAGSSSTGRRSRISSTMLTPPQPLPSRAASLRTRSASLVPPSDPKSSSLLTTAIASGTHPDPIQSASRAATQSQSQMLAPGPSSGAGGVQGRSKSESATRPHSRSTSGTLSVTLRQSSARPSASAVGATAVTNRGGGRERSSLFPYVSDSLHLNAGITRRGPAPAATQGPGQGQGSTLPSAPPFPVAAAGRIPTLPSVQITPAAAAGRRQPQPLPQTRPNIEISFPSPSSSRSASSPTSFPPRPRMMAPGVFDMRGAGLERLTGMLEGEGGRGQARRSGPRKQDEQEGHDDQDDQVVGRLSLEETKDRDGGGDREGRENKGAARKA